MSIAILLLALVFAGCASPQRFGYTVSPAPAAAAGPARTVEVLPVSDVRTNKQIDEYFSATLLEDVRAAVASELVGTGLFRPVNVLSNAVGGSAEILLHPELTRLEWEVPGYSAMIGKAFLISLTTGGIGGGIYISTLTTVNGFAVVRVELKEAQGGRVLLAQEYPGFYTEKIAKGSCDTRTTRARVVTEAFKRAMDEFKKELQRLPFSPPAESKSDIR